MRAGISPSRYAALGLALAALVSACAPSRPAAPEPPPVNPPAAAVNQPETMNPKPGTDLYTDPLPPGAIARMGKADAWPDNGVTYVAFSPDGKTLASGSYDGTVRLWATSTGKERQKFEVGKFVFIAYSPDGMKLVCGRFDGEGMFHLKDTFTSNEILRFEAPKKPICSVALSPDGKTLAFGGASGAIWFWDATTGKDLHRKMGQEDAYYYKEEHWVVGINSMAFSQDGRMLAAACHEGFLLWEVASGNECIFEQANLEPFEPVYSIAISPDGKMLAVGLVYSGIRLRETATGKLICKLNEDPGKDYLLDPIFGGEELFNHERKTVYSLAFSPDGKTLASGSGDSTILIWDVAALLKDRK